MEYQDHGSQHAAMRLDTNIYFLIAVPDWKPEEATPLQGFALSLCENARLIRAASFFPSNIYDFSKERIDTFLARRIGGVNPTHWYPQSPRAVMSMPLHASIPFTVVLLGTGQDPSQYAQWVSDSEVPPTIVAEKGGDLAYKQFDLEHLKKRFLQICDLIPETIDHSDVSAARAAIESWTLPSERTLAYQVGGHASVTPNLMALSAAGFTNTVYGRFDKIKEGNRPYVEQIVKTALSIFEERDRIGQRNADRTFRRPPDLNLFAPAISPEFFASPIPSSLGGPEKAQYRAAKNALQRQAGYNFETRTDAQIRALFGVESSELSSGQANLQPHTILLLRQRELALATECAGALAASEISAVLRLPNDINRTVGAIRQFAAHYRSSSPNSRKRLLAFRSVQARLAKAFPSEFYDLINRSQEGIRIISDAHLEWLDIDGLPLAISKNVSRIPVTPGNLFVEQLTSKPPLHLTPQDFKQVLVISALKRTDPIASFFQIAFDIFEKEWRDNISISFAEVCNEDQLVEALNSFNGSLVVFDGHGSHEVNQPGYLHLMDTPVDVWFLRGRVKRPPPIVVLSACDTHAADRNHATVANGFLSLGTRAVLASVFPLAAPDAAAFAARLLYRVSSFVPTAIRQFGRALTWTEVVSGMIRMQLLTDFLRSLLRARVISHDIYVDVHEKGNMAINGGYDRPFDIVRDLLVSHGADDQIVDKALAKAVANSSAISYINVGRPETILVDTEDRLESYFRQLSG